jgi:hypothetical protein
MAKKGMLDAAQKTVVGAAKLGARGVKSVASGGATGRAGHYKAIEKERQEKRREKGRLCQEARRRQNAKC